MTKMLFRTLPISEFQADYWGKKICFLGKALPTLPFSFDEFRSVLQSAAPYFCDSVRLSRSEGENDSGRDVLVLAKEPAEALHALRRGSAVTINRLERQLAPSHPLSELLSELSYLCGTAISESQIAAFYSPPYGKAFGRHSDRNHIFVVQIEGEKTWAIGGADDPPRRLTLHSGDVLYVPYGVPHDVSGGTDNSLSLTFILRPPTWRDLAVESVLGRLDVSNNPNLGSHGPLPFGWIDEIACPAMRGEIFKIPAEFHDLGLDIVDILRAGRRMAVQILPSISAGDALLETADLVANVQLDTVLRGSWNEPLIRLNFVNRILLAAPGKPQLDWLGEFAPALDFVVAAKECFVVGDLPELYDDDSKIAICRQLLQSTYVTTAPLAGRNS